MPSELLGGGGVSLILTAGANLNPLQEEDGLVLTLKALGTSRVYEVQGPFGSIDSQTVSCRCGDISPDVCCLPPPVPSQRGSPFEAGLVGSQTGREIQRAEPHPAFKKPKMAQLVRSPHGATLRGAGARCEVSASPLMSEDYRRIQDPTNRPPKASQEQETEHFPPNLKIGAVEAEKSNQSKPDAEFKLTS